MEHSRYAETQKKTQNNDKMRDGGIMVTKHANNSYKTFESKIDKKILCIVSKIKNDIHKDKTKQITEIKGRHVIYLNIFFRPLL